jgi:hypothetical protein
MSGRYDEPTEEHRPKASSSVGMQLAINAIVKEVRSIVDISVMPYIDNECSTARITEEDSLVSSMTRTPLRPF